MISVAMAAYKGEAYIEAQLRSILEQLGPEDEVVVSDDCPGSTMSDLVLSLAAQDPRIRYTEGPSKGVIQNFNHAISKTKGDYIFLSDQDDVWLPGKVDACLQALRSATLVLHDATVTDGNLNVTEKSFFAARGSAPGYFRNIMKNSYMGCCMAFRKELKDVILPIPEQVPMHDQYIGLMAERVGTVTFLQKPLIYYRVHGGNVTGGKTSLQDKLKWRADILRLTETNKKTMKQVAAVNNVQDKKKISATIVTYNNQRTIEEAVRTLLDTVKDNDLTLYIVDNGSTDNTLPILKEQFASDPRFVLLETGKNIGFGAGHNQVLPFLESDYHCVVNPDILLKDNAVDRMAEYMNEHDNVVLLSPKICYPDGREQILGKRNPHFLYILANHRWDRVSSPNKVIRRYAMLDEDYSKPFEIENATGCFMMFKTDTFKALSGFDDRYFMYFEDCDITRRARKLGKVLHFPQATIYHAWARGSKSNRNLLVIHIQSMLKYYLKWRML